MLILVVSWVSVTFHALLSSTRSWYFRYVDDIFAISLSCYLQSLQEKMAAVWAPLTLEFEVSTERVNFLDLTIFRSRKEWYPNSFLDPIPRLLTKLFQKPKNLYHYLHWTSNHDRSVFAAIIKGEVIRYLRLCSREKDFIHAKFLLKNRLEKRC